jgi:hypothetical protein
MSNFKILGAQRVKALTEMLKEQEAKAVAEINKGKLTRSKADDIVHTELGIKEYFDEIKEIEARLEKLSEMIEPKTGNRFSLNKQSRSYGNVWSDYHRKINEVQDADTKQRIADVQAEFKRKEQRLWLCETLEEAKAIVGIE